MKANKHKEDKHGEWIRIGDEVNVDKPGDLDLHKSEFSGIVVSIKEDYVVVQDQDENCFDLAGHQLEVQIHEDGQPIEYQDDSDTCKDCGIGKIRSCMVPDNVGHGLHEESYCTYCDSH